MHFKELPIIKEQGSVNLNPFPASCLYESRGQQARPRLALALFIIFNGSFMIFYGLSDCSRVLKDRKVNIISKYTHKFVIDYIM